MNNFGKKVLRKLGILSALGAILIVASCGSDDGGGSKPMPEASFTTSVSDLDVTVVNTSVEADSYSWDFGDGSAALTITEGTYTYAEAGTYTITLTASNDNGDDTATADVTVTDPPAEVNPLPAASLGAWVLDGDGALRVGPGDGDGSWWTSDAQVVTDRACFFDDTWTFNAAGELIIAQGDETWLEAWQGTDPEACGAGVAPHLSGTYGYSYDDTANTLTVTGLGAYLGLPKAVNGAELSDPANAPESVVYNVFSVDATNMEVRIHASGDAAGAWWAFKLAKQQ